MITGLAALLFATSTLCHATQVQVDERVTTRLLDGCGPQYEDNLLWHLDRADSVSGALDGSYTRRATGKGAVVYVCDVGIFAEHDEFQRDDGRVIIAGLNTDTKNICPGGNDALAPCWLSDSSMILFGHGTGVASVIAGKTLGVAPGAKIVAVKVIGDEKTWIRAMQMIIQHAFAPGTPQFRTAIINISGGVDLKPMPQFEALMRKMIKGVDANGSEDPNGKRFFFSVAAGNAYPFLNGKPAQCADDYSVKLSPGYLGRDVDGLVTVGGIDRTNNLWAGSCYGYSVELLAPAETMFLASVHGHNEYQYQPVDVISGTSFATPYGVRSKVETLVYR